MAPGGGFANAGYMIVRSQSCWEPLRTSWAYANGSSPRATPWSPPQTRTARTPNLIRSSSTPKSSSQLRKLELLRRWNPITEANNDLPFCRFHPGYLTAERLAKAKKLKLAITAGIGSDHVDLNAANKTNGGITVAEVTGSNVVSVAEHVVMTILILVRNYNPAHESIERGDWDVAEAAKAEYDLEGKVVGTVAVGRIGERVLRRLTAFDCKELLYYDYQPLSPEKEKEIGCRRVTDLEEMISQCDVVTINCPLHEKTRGLFNKELISKMKKGMCFENASILQVVSV
jgi:phosphoglycerate dehydrogenase-like enzyme